MTLMTYAAMIANVLYEVADGPDRHSFPSGTDSLRASAAEVERRPDSHPAIRMIAAAGWFDGLQMREARQVRRYAERILYTGQSRQLTNPELLLEGLAEIANHADVYQLRVRRVQGLAGKASMHLGPGSGRRRRTYPLLDRQGVQHFRGSLDECEEFLSKRLMTR